ncbi:NUDIX domain-containing protein [Planifilum fulgidum]|uniref:NUDIX domain-containing protein n=1 Tax=Planifilum fulgidum TaxID=201973 RepID=A0A1I2P7Q3_9BACL|nr:NUDIX domain-containing protein [Planifilum fulgidum]SFG09676.1 NUDIX domain-containing protein [Planifilum fulgidum]
MDETLMDIASLTRNQPFCAGVILAKGRCLLLTLNADGVPETLKGTAWRVGGVGGGQEPGETVWDCALREAREEAFAEVELIPSPSTYFHNMDTGAIRRIRVRDPVPPLLFSRTVNPRPDRPYAPGLPTGPFIHFALFLSRPKAWDTIRPGDDVQGLLLCPVDGWTRLKAGNKLKELARSGIEVIGRPNVDWERRPWFRRRSRWTPFSPFWKNIRNCLTS